MDLSVGAVISLTAVVSAVLMAGDSAVPYAVATTLLVGTAIGLANSGVLIAFNRVALHLTLGMAIVVYGITQIYSGGTARGVVAPGFREVFNVRIGGLMPCWRSPLVVIALVGIVVQRSTISGAASI